MLYTNETKAAAGGRRFSDSITGNSAAQQVRTWLDETAESMKAAERRDTEFRKEE